MSTSEIILFIPPVVCLVLLMIATTFLVMYLNEN